MSVCDCSGGRNADVRSGGGAGGIAISYYARGAWAVESVLKQNVNNNNWHSLRDLIPRGCSGGTKPDGGAGAGGIVLSYDGRSNTNNSQTLFNISASHCSGGDWSQGAGAVAVAFVRGITTECTISLNGSLFASNQGGIEPGLGRAVGVAGAVLFTTPTGSRDNSFQLQSTRFIENSLSDGCVS